MMEQKVVMIFLIFVTLVVHGTESLGDDDEDEGPLVVGYYKEICPLLEDIVRHNVEVAVFKDPRMAASLLRMHFHDCFVMGCDASVLLDSFGGIISEKQAGPNLNSLRGFEVIDQIKYLVEEACPETVSCADILALAARDSVVSRGGPSWDVWLGRRDSLQASFNGANQFIPAPNSSLQSLISNFKQQGLDIGDLVALSGSHTIGKARCLNFRQRVYDINFRGEYELYDKYRRYTSFRRILQSICPKSGRNNQLSPLDFMTPARFDNHYYVNLLQGKGLLISDNVLVTQDHEGGEVYRKVWDYATVRDSSLLHLQTLWGTSNPSLGIKEKSGGIVGLSIPKLGCHACMQRTWLLCLYLDLFGQTQRSRCIFPFYYYFVSSVNAS